MVGTSEQNYTDPFNWDHNGRDACITLQDHFEGDLNQQFYKKKHLIKFNVHFIMGETEF